MRPLHVILIFLVIPYICIAGYIRIRSGDLIDDETSEKVTLRGFNLGGWLVYEDKLFWTINLPFKTDPKSEPKLMY
jgi:hypothetical protein